MTYIQHIGPVTALIAGILILIMPRLLNYIIALYLIVIGLVGLFGKYSAQPPGLPMCCAYSFCMPPSQRS
jgi:hypothetical protein